MTFKERYQKERADFAEFMKWYPFTLEDLDGEQWADIEGYEGRYQISTFGRVKSFMRFAKGKILRPMLNETNYLTIIIDLKERGRKFFRVHRLVAQAFIPNPEGKSDVNHIDGCKINAYVGNLEWATRSENVQHAFDTGLAIPPQGEEHWGAKLTNKQAWYIRDNPEKLNTIELAKIFGVDSTVISDVQLGRTYKTAGGKIRQRKIPQGEERSNSRLTNEQVRYIRDNPDKLNTVELAKSFEVATTTISDVQIGKRYKTAGGKIREKIESPGAKLAPAQVIEIRENIFGLTQSQLAERFNVSPSVISDIQLGKRYKTAGGKIRKKIKPRIPDDIRNKIRAECKQGVYGFGTYVLAKKYGVAPGTVRKIINEK